MKYKFNKDVTIADIVKELSLTINPSDITIEKHFDGMLSIEFKGQNLDLSQEDKLDKFLEKYGYVKEKK